MSNYENTEGYQIGDNIGEKIYLIYNYKEYLNLQEF